MILLEMRNLLPECCQFVTFLSLLVAAQHGALISRAQAAGFGHKSGLGEIGFAAPVGHFTNFLSLRNFKKPSRPHYLCTWILEQLSRTWFSKRQQQSPCCGESKACHPTGAGAWDTGHRGSLESASLAQQALIQYLLCVGQAALC